MRPDSSEMKKLKYIPEFEGVRAFAIMFVLIGHFIPVSNDYFPFALIGVRLFLLLSGFLITCVLLSSKERYCSGLKN